MTITIYKSLTELYADVLRQRRDIEREEQDGAAICVWCKERLDKHITDKRCSSWACSQYFKSVRSKEKDTLNRAVVLIEELLAMGE